MTPQMREDMEREMERECRNWHPLNVQQSNDWPDWAVLLLWVVVFVSVGVVGTFAFNWVEGLCR